MSNYFWIVTWSYVCKKILVSSLRSIITITENNFCFSATFLNLKEKYFPPLADSNIEIEYPILKINQASNLDMGICLLSRSRLISISGVCSYCLRGQVRHGRSWVTPVYAHKSLLVNFRLKFWFSTVIFVCFVRVDAQGLLWLIFSYYLTYHLTDGSTHSLNRCS